MAQRKGTKQPKMWKFKVYQGGMVVASGDGPFDVIQREAARYAIQYAQDGPCRVTITPVRRKVSR